MQEKNAELKQAAADRADEIAALKSRVRMLARTVPAEQVARW